CSRMVSPRASQRNTLMRPAPNASSAPIRIGSMKRPSRSLVRRPTVPVRPARSPRAIAFGVKDNSSAMESTRARVDSATSPLPFSAFEAVAIDTPARAATSLSVTALVVVLSLIRLPPERLSGRSLDGSPILTLYLVERLFVQFRRTRSHSRKSQGVSMHITRHRAVLRAAAAAVAAGMIVGGLAACAPSETGDSAAPISGDGTDDGATLTLWTRAPLERQAKLLVEAYNSSHENQVELTVVPNDDYVAKVGAAAGSGGLPDLFAADIVYVPNWVEQGLFADLTDQIDGLDYKDQINKGHLSAGTLDGKSYVLPFV